MPPTESSAAESDWADSQQPHNSKSQSQSQQRQQTQPQTHNSQAQTQQQPPPFSSRVSQQRLAKQKPHVAGRLHTRSSSSKGTHSSKHHGQSTAASSSAAVRPQNRRTQSEQRLTHSSNNAAANASATNVATALKKTASQTAIARNRSDLAGPASRRHVSSKTSLTADRPKRSGSGANVVATAAAAGSAAGTAAQRSSKAHKTQVLFDVGTADNDDDANEGATEDDDSEWQDASTSASPYITKHAPSAAKSSTQQPTRTASQPKMSAPTAASSTTMVASPDASSDMPTSRFIGAQTSTLASEGSFYTTTQGSTDTATSADHMRRITNGAASTTAAKRNSARPFSSLAAAAALTDDEDAAGIASASALGTTAMPRRVKPAEKSRTQQKLDLQRASSGMDAVALPNMHAGMAVANSHRIVNVMQPGLDGTATRDPRVAKLLEQTGAAYMVMRRYQNPIARSVDRLAMGSGPDKLGPLLRKGISSGATSVVAATPGSGASGAPTDGATGRRTSTASRPGTTRLMQTPENGFDEQRAAPILSAPAPDEEEISVILQNLWDRTVDFGVSQ